MMKTILKQIKENNLSRFYLLYGECRYLLRLYEKKLTDAAVAPDFAMMNLDVFEGASSTLEQIENAVSTLPLFSDRRAVVLRFSGLFESGRKDDSEKMAALLPNIPETTLLICVETGVDKRGKLYKQASSRGTVAEMKTPDEKDLAEWVVRELKHTEHAVAFTDALYLVRTAEHDMDALESEMGKLAAHAGIGEAVTKADIDAVCTKALSLRIFELVDAVANGNVQRALDIFGDFMVMKESPLMVLSMIARQYRLLLHCKQLLAEGAPGSVLAARMDVRPFVAESCARQCRNLSVSQIQEALDDCLKADLGIKTGRLNDKLALEMLIIKHAGVEK